MRATFIGLAGSLVPLALTQRLDKPPLETGLDYLQKGLLEYLGPVKSSYKKWTPGWIPSDCKTMTVNANLSVAHVETFSVQYEDVGTSVNVAFSEISNQCPNDPWLLCRHIDSPDPLENMIDLFGRVPVRARQWVRHIVNLPDPTNFTSAYNWAGNIAMFESINRDLTLFIHETGHSLDLLGAYPDNPLSTSRHWHAQYAKDSHVPDPYSQSNIYEDLAQNTVVAAYDLNVPGGIGVVEPKWRDVLHQFDTIEVEQRKAGGFAGERGSVHEAFEQ
ncbi:hypothetical protein HO133_006930 [Letharia lupina]|uniref:Conidiation-specific protein 13 n=1 Tax=Letharia lupina TaxID=560253 RepID=A0A8H6F7E1_9LECA|nr:uncharacterized protein HO133_006930 [Letharia lupina]KAF6217414.1 hypothetical protein HO133_006930 [Letharia lupina]